MRLEHIYLYQILFHASVTSVLTCRGQGCHNLISGVHPLLCGMIMGQSHYKGRAKH